MKTSLRVGSRSSKAIPALTVNIGGYVLYVYERDGLWIARVERQPGPVMLFSAISQEDAKTRAIKAALKDQGMSPVDIEAVSHREHDWKPCTVNFPTLLDPQT